MAGEQRMTDLKRDYQAFLLRLWCSSSAAGAPWHAMLENAHTGERHSFAELDGLFNFLRQAARSPPPADNKGERDPAL